MVTDRLVRLAPRRPIRRALDTARILASIEHQQHSKEKHQFHGQAPGLAACYEPIVREMSNKANTARTVKVVVMPTVRKL